MSFRCINNVELPPIGLGGMNLSHAYGTPPDVKGATSLLHSAFELGVRHFDTAALYGFGANESLLGRALKPFRQEIYLASKCGMSGVNNKRVIDGRPSTLISTLDESLNRLQVDYIDLYYLHRWDKEVPIEESVGALARMVEAGKIGGIGLSEVSTKTLRRAHQEHPIKAVQTEYSLWTRNPEISILDTSRELGAALVAFSPLGRGFLTGAVTDLNGFEEKDIRRNMPRFQEPHFSNNGRWLAEFAVLAEDCGCTMAQLSLAWLLAQGDHVIPIPGTTSAAHLAENTAAQDIVLPAETLQKMDRIINSSTVSGARYPLATQQEIDTEDFE